MDLRFGGIIEAQLRAAVGDSAVFAKSPDGTWAHIPDPDATILARVQAGDHAYRLTTLAPNAALLRQIFDRLLGRTRQALAVKVPAMPSTSDADLAASLTALLRRWHPATRRRAETSRCSTGQPQGRLTRVRGVPLASEALGGGELV